MTPRVRLQTWTAGPADGMGAGRFDGTALDGDHLVLATPAGARDYTDPHADTGPVRYEEGTWTSPWVSPGFGATDLVPSWNARTPAGTWLEVSLQVRGAGAASGWLVLGRWAESDRDIRPTSVPGQEDPRVRVLVDRVVAREGHRVTGYRLRATLLRRPGTDASPRVSLLAVAASDVVDGQAPRRTPPGPAAGTELDVPAYSQMLHRGEYPQWAAGGESWCSPTSTSMVMAHWGREPDPADYAWVEESYPDRFVDHAARHTYDHAYGGPGNWPFNTAYAGRHGLVAYVTRLRDLQEAERFVAAGIPLVVGVSFRADQMEGAGYDTEGHLLTVIGFTREGDVVSNDPASHEVPSNDEVRTVFRRAQFEDAWLGRAGGLTYVVHPPDAAVPAPPAEPNWWAGRG